MEPASSLVAPSARDIEPSQVVGGARARNASDGAVKSYILDRLAYKNMLDREQEVTKAHDKTLEWMFHPSTSTASGIIASVANTSVPTPSVPIRSVRTPSVRTPSAPACSVPASPVPSPCVPSPSASTLVTPTTPTTDPDPGLSHRHVFQRMFTTWLTSMDLGPVFWITGKPGSGKSTLMRFLSHHPKVLELLRYWAGDRPIIAAAYYFWASGSREQKSMTGLLRYLLHQILSTHEDLIPSAFPEIWKRLKAMSTKELINLELELTFADLKRAFASFVDATLPTMNICLFIDGLDELDGDHRIAIDFLTDLSSGERTNFIKICVSSRPWDIFRDAFQDSVPNISLHDLTYGDMCRYTTDKLERNVYLRRLRKRDPDGFREFTDSVVQRADGVFLWARLAIESMLKDMESHYDLPLLNNELQKLPANLDDLFYRLVFLDESPTDKQEVAMLFQLVQAREVVADFIKDESARSLTVWEIAFTLDDNGDHIKAMNRDVEQATDREVQVRCKLTADHIMKQFAGLLAIHWQRGDQKTRAARFLDDRLEAAEARLLTDAKVTYAHRTIRDWLVGTESVYNGLTATDSTLPTFDAHLRLLGSFVLRLTYPLEEIEHHRRLDEWYPDIALAMTHARYIVKDPKRLGPQFVDKIDELISWYWVPRSPFDHWARNAFGSYEVRMKAPLIQEPFLCLATKFGLKKYLEYKVPKIKSNANDTEDARAPTPLLTYATEYLCSRKKTIFPLSDPGLVRYLLENASINPTALSSSQTSILNSTPSLTLTSSLTSSFGPNEAYTDFNTRKLTTPWETLLRSLRTADRRGWISKNNPGEQRWVTIVNLFMEFHADIHAVLQADNWDSEINAFGVLKMLKEKYGFPDVQKLRA
ncbi:Fc.00g114620.m01.CDS01 [Cosmosporella sp. VM-42]